MLSASLKSHSKRVAAAASWPWKYVLLQLLGFVDSKLSVSFVMMLDDMIFSALF
jgi:hypothetical protein